MIPSTRIHPTACLDEPFRRFQGAKEPEGITYRQSRYGFDVSIGAAAVIGRGVVLHDRVVIDHQCIVEPNATVGSDSLLIYRAIVGAEATIGSKCVIGGFVAERCVVGSNCRLFGQIVHRQADSTQEWDESEPEPSAVIGDWSFIGFGAIVIGGVHVGPRAYICAGAVVTRDVPSHHIAFGINRIVPCSEWPGALATNPALRQRSDSR